MILKKTITETVNETIDRLILERPNYISRYYKATRYYKFIIRGELHNLTGDSIKDTTMARLIRGRVALVMSLAVDHNKPLHIKEVA